MQSWERLAQAPSSVRQASWLLISYGLVIAVGTLWYVIDTGVFQDRDVLRGTLRAVFMIVVALRLPLLEKSTWWITVLVCGFFVVLGGIGVLALVVLWLGGHEAPSVLAFLRGLILLWLLGQALYLLLQSDTRNLFH